MKRPLSGGCPPPVIRKRRDSFNDDEMEDDTELFNQVQSQRLATQQSQASQNLPSQPHIRPPEPIFKVPYPPSVSSILKQPTPPRISQPSLFRPPQPQILPTRIIRPPVQPQQTSIAVTRPPRPQPTSISRHPPPKQVQHKKPTKTICTQTTGFSRHEIAPMRARRYCGQLELMWQRMNEFDDPKATFFSNFPKIYNFYDLEDNPIPEEKCDDFDDVKKDTNTEEYHFWSM